MTRDRSVVKASGTKTEYLRRQTREILDGLYGGDVSDFCAAFTGRTSVTGEDRRALLTMIEQWNQE